MHLSNLKGFINSTLPLYKILKLNLSNFLKSTNLKIPCLMVCMYLYYTVESIYAYLRKPNKKGLSLQVAVNGIKIASTVYGNF